MKFKIKYFLAALALSLTTFSCTDLDVDVDSQYTDSNFPVTDADMEAVCGPAYTNFKPTLGRWYWMLLTSCTDEGMLAANGSNWYDNGKYGEAVLHTWHANSELVFLNWDALFGSISQCNSILKILEAAPETIARNRAIEEMRVMRALYYFWTMDNFGDLPIITEFGNPTPARSPRKEVAEFLIAELKDCIDNDGLSSTVDKTTYSRPTKYLAMSLLAKIYVNWPVYAEPNVANYNASAYTGGSNPYLNDLVALCDGIIKSEQYSLLGGAATWLDKFKDKNGPGTKDFIFAFPFDWVLDQETWGGLTIQRFWCHPFFEQTMGMKKKPSGVMRAIPEYLDLFTLPNDVRNKIWRGGPQYIEENGVIGATPYTYEVSKKTLDQYYTGADGDTKVKWHVDLSRELVIRGNSASEKAENLRKLDLGDDELGKAMGWRSVKFYPTLESTVHGQSNDMPFIRYADVLLMKAEAILRGATPTMGQTADGLINEIRKAAEAPQDANYTLQDLLDERGREFTDELWRRNDLIRFGAFEDDWGLKTTALGTQNKDTYRRIFAIPKNTMTLNTHWVQNQGY